MIHHFLYSQLKFELYKSYFSQLDQYIKIK